MILKLRKRHRWMIRLLAVLIPTLFVLALIDRKSVPAMAEIPGQREIAAPGDPVFTAEWTLMNTVVVVNAGMGAQNRALLALWPQKAPHAPDILVYWGTDDDLSTAFLLGELAGERQRVFQLPKAASQNAGKILFYSQAHGEQLDSAPLPAIMAGGQP